MQIRFRIRNLDLTTSLHVSRGLHVNAAQTAINTVIQYEFCTVAWGVIFLVIMWAGSMIRGFKHAEYAAILSAGTMFICYLLVVIGKFNPW